MTTTWRWVFRARVPGSADVERAAHDGDTVTLLLDRGLDGTTTLVSLRLIGVYCPELRQKGGTACRDECQRWLDEHAAGKWPFVVETFRTSTDAESERSFNRYLAQVSAGDDSLNDHMTAFVKAKGYAGGTGSDHPKTKEAREAPVINSGASHHSRPQPEDGEVDAASLRRP